MNDLSGLIVVGAVLAVFFVFLALRTQAKKKRLSSLIAAGAQVIDVRSQAEFASGHHPKALNIPVDTLRSKVKSLGAKDQAVIVYCASGGRSAIAAGILRELGFTAVTNAGGFAAMPQ